ncbi:hypothetical protein DID80_04725 [Candidatus Marinamargulisbacteria bacterium SCGC AAA071-K20]|nr:hypothetical protein DID80_04725 [Candidatus Marinamargulisbacteria bacterium SCGC AAA071-K20]
MVIKIAINIFNKYYSRLFSVSNVTPYPKNLEALCLVLLVYDFMMLSKLSQSLWLGYSFSIPLLTGVLISMSDSFCSLWGLTAVCPINYTPHLLLWHFIPSFLLSLFGVILGHWLKGWDSQKII